MFSERFRQAGRLEGRVPGDLHGAACVLRRGLNICLRNDFSDCDRTDSGERVHTPRCSIKRAVHPDKCFFMTPSVGKLPADHLQDEEAFNVRWSGE